MLGKTKRNNKLIKISGRKCINIKNESLRQINSSSINGLPNIFRSKHLLFKIIWIIIFTLFTCLSIFSFIQIVKLCYVRSGYFNNLT